MRRWGIAAVVGVPVVALGWWGWVAAGAREVEVRVFQFRPGRVDVGTDGSITWVNRDDIGHTVTSGAPGDGDGRFDAVLDGRSATATVRFAEPGVYPYFCRRHPAMRGEIRVQ
jgi:plastocyanin